MSMALAAYAVPADLAAQVTGSRSRAVVNRVLRHADNTSGPVFKSFRTILPTEMTDCHGVRTPVPDYAAGLARPIEGVRLGLIEHWYAEGAHPDLAGRAARAGAMSAASVAEQASAGLDRLTDAEYERFTRLNAAYTAAFGFPFIIAVRRHDKAAILAAFERRLLNTKDVEIATALEQVCEITRLRLDALVAP